VQIWTVDEQATTLAVTHAIHPDPPVREGMPVRPIARDLMDCRRLPTLDSVGYEGNEERLYRSGSRGLSRDYAPMTKVFRSVIARTVSQPLNLLSG